MTKAELIEKLHKQAGDAMTKKAKHKMRVGFAVPASGLVTKISGLVILVRMPRWNALDPGVRRKLVFDPLLRAPRSPHPTPSSGSPAESGLGSRSLSEPMGSGVWASGESLAAAPVSSRRQRLRGIAGPNA